MSFDVTTTPLASVLNQITEAFRPKLLSFTVNGKDFSVWRISEGWVWTSPDGDQEDYDIAPFETAYECQQSAIWFKGVSHA